MRTLVIHPFDISTGMLSVIYEDKDWTVVDDNDISKSKLKRLIRDHDRIIMLGHGTAYGLINGTQNRLMVDSSLVYLLREKVCVCIWCNADMFVHRYNLKGFYTGMIISEEIEANMYKVNTKTNEVATSNTVISEAFRLAIDAEPKDMVQIVTDNYVGDGEVFDFNRSRIYHTWITED